MKTYKLKAVVASSLLALFVGCNLFEGSADFKDIKAEITEISKYADSTVLVKVDVYTSGNADDCSFYLLCDSIPVSINVFSAKKRLITRSTSGCHLQQVYEFVAYRISPGKRYFYQLAEWGMWETGGQTSSRVVMVGSQHEYVLN